MVIRDSSYPRLPRLYWGEVIYATPGSGKTYVANKYRDVVDGDELIVEAIREVKSHSFQIGHYNDPREVIFRYFRYVNFSRKYMWQVYNVAIRKMRKACNIQDVVLIGTVDLMSEADRIFVQREDYYVRNGFNQIRETDEVDNTSYDVPVHYTCEYLDNTLQQTCREL